MRGERNGDRHPHGKADSAAHCHEGDSPKFHFPWIAQGILLPRKRTISGYASGIWHGDQDDQHPSYILVLDPDGGEGGGALWDRLTDPPQVNSGGPTVTHDL